jgi:arylsulfatase
MQVPQAGAFVDPRFLEELTGNDAVASKAFVRLGLFSSGPQVLPGNGTGGWRVDRDRTRLMLSRSGTLILPLHIPSHALSLAFKLGARGPKDAAWSLRVAMLSLDAERRELLEVDQTSGSGWIRHQVPLAGLGGSDQFLILKAAVPEPTTQLVLSSLQLSEPAELSEENRSASSTESEAGRRGDVVLIVLDAARADHFGVYGYPRDTTPHIDRFAKAALVFNRAFSGCCATVCSVPNMLTGRSVFTFDKETGFPIDQRIETLAETLHAAGYRTVAFLANPNASSPSIRRGFDEYYESWELKKKRPERPSGIDPHWLSREAGRVIASAAPETPLFTLLHYVPPHEPYNPPEEFDVFGDPEYEGPVVPGLQLRQIRLRPPTLPLSEADLEELVSHYDGNLRKADDAVRVVFEALKTAGRWDDSIVLVTSDHGEAFFEHGHQGHNNTLYDEMFHIPLIVKVPAYQSLPAGRYNRLATLADVVPTILARVGQPVDPLADGVDLLSSDFEADEAERVLFLRKPGLYEYAVRTRRFKAILHTAGHPRLPPRLFDLERDADEQHNVVREHSLLFVGLALLLEQHVSDLVKSDLQPGEAKRSPEELETLRALGYL